MTRSPIRDTLLGASMNNDRLWIIHTPTFVGAITEYNEEVTGLSRELAELDPKIFCYGGNAYYILGQYVQERGWRVEAVEDRL